MDKSILVRVPFAFSVIVAVRTDEDPVDPLVAPCRDIWIEADLALHAELDELETRRFE
jgi:hypothetical protein